MYEKAFELSIKSVDEERRIITGIATTPAADRSGDVIEPLGARFTNPIRLLLHHDKKQPVGEAILGEPTAAGIPFSAALPFVDEPGIVRDRVEEAWHSLKYGLFGGVSVGFRPDGPFEKVVQKLKNGLRFLKTEIVELSLVVIPGNSEARILTVRSLEKAAPGRDLVPDRARSARPMTTAEQIQQWSNTRAPKVARMGELMEKSSAAGSTLDQSESEEFDTLEREVGSLDDQIRRARIVEKMNVAQAIAVNPPEHGGAPTGAGAIVPRVEPYRTVSVKANVEKGVPFVRAAMALLQAHGDYYRAQEIAKQWESSTPEVGIFLKAAVAPATTTDPVWAGYLAVRTNIASEFIELLRPATVLGRVSGFRVVPFNTSVPMQTAGGSYGWVGQGAPKGVTKLVMGQALLNIAKAAGIIVLTEELVKLSTPSAEAVVRADMIAGIAAFLDDQFLNPAVAEVTNISPASITNGTTALTSTGNALSDIHALITWFTSNNIPLRGVTIVMSESNGFTLGMHRHADGSLMFPNVGVAGGTIEGGINVITSNKAGTNVIAFQPGYILYADDGGVSIDVSREAAVQLDSAPDNPALATTVLTSLWQNNLVGLRAERYINWKRVLLESVKYVSGANYPAPTLSAAQAKAAADARAAEAKRETNGEKRG